MKRKAFLAVLFGALVGGFGGVFIKWMQIPPTSIAWIRMSIPTVLIFFILIFTRTKLFRGNYKTMLLGSGLNAIRMYFFLFAFVHTSIGNAVILFYTWPIFATLFGAIFLKEKISKTQLLLLLLAFAGIIIAYSNQQFSIDNDDFMGMSSAMASAFIYALSMIVFKKEASNYSNWELVFYQNLLGAFIFLPFFLSNEPAAIPSDWMYGTAYAFVVGILAFNLIFYGLRFLPASKVSMITYVEVITASLASIFIIGEQFSINMLIGGFCIILSTLLLSILPKELPNNN